MKVLLVTGIFPPDSGGPASYVPKIAEGLRHQGHDVVAVVTLSDRLDHDDQHYGFRVVRLLRTRLRLLRSIHAVFEITRLALQSDVLYLNGLVLEGVFVAKFLSIRPVVVKVVGDLIWEKATNKGATSLDLDAFQKSRLSLQWHMLRSLQSFYISSADAVITPSQYLAGIVAGWGVDKRRNHLVYNAVDTGSSAHFNNLAKYDLVTVARLVPWKGLVDLIEVCAALNLSLRIIGDGPMREELEALVELSGAKVSFAGRVVHDRIPEELRSARLFVLNSSYEGLPHIVLEAKASGVAVLASAAGGTPETIQHRVDGWLVPVNDKLALTNAISLLLDDQELRYEIAQAGFYQVSKSFSFASQLEATINVLAAVCK
jgi:glycosyltransferase involved in cell wall biosynthesis